MVHQEQVVHQEHQVRPGQMVVRGLLVLTVHMELQAPAERLEPPVKVAHRAVAGLPEAQGLTVPAGRRALPALQERTARQGHQE